MRHKVKLIFMAFFIGIFLILMEFLLRKKRNTQLFIKSEDLVSSIQADDKNRAEKNYSVRLSNINENIEEYSMTKLFNKKIEDITKNIDLVTKMRIIETEQNTYPSLYQHNTKFYSVGCFYNTIINFNSIAKAINNRKIKNEKNILFMNELICHLFLLDKFSINLKKYDDFIYENLLKSELEKYVNEKEKNKFIIANLVFKEFTSSIEKEHFIRKLPLYTRFKEFYKKEVDKLNSNKGI